MEIKAVAPMSNVRKKYDELYNKSLSIVEKNEKGKTIQIFVGDATCEIAAGADILYGEVKNHIDASGRKDIFLKQVGCTGRCSLEPIVSILEDGKALISYSLVNSQKIHEIFISHVLERKPLQKYFLNGEPANY